MSVQSKSRSWISWAIAFAVAFLVVGLVRFFWIESYRISTDAMNESLYRGDYVLVDKWLSSGNPGRNRVVLFTSPLLRDSVARPLFVSRCIGMPGACTEDLPCTACHRISFSFRLAETGYSGAGLATGFNWLFAFSYRL